MRATIDDRRWARAGPWQSEGACVWKREKALVNCSECSATPRCALESFTVMTQLTRALERTQSLTHECEYASQSRQRAPLCAAATADSDANGPWWQWLEGRAGFNVCKHTTSATTTTTITTRGTTITTDECYPTLMGSTLSGSVYTRACRV